ncbi:MAG: hydroxymethylbilane synthase, partial [Pirellula sp.]
SDCLISSLSANLNDFPAGSRIGTGSPRRRSQLLHLRPDLDILDIRGNVETRLAKLAQGSYDAIILAFAGLHRLNFESKITEKLTLEQMLPAVGQAALGLETRSQDLIAIEAVRHLNDPVTLACVRAERGLLRALRAGCLAPVAAHATEREGKLRMRAKVYSRDGVTMIASDVSTSIDLTTIFASTTPESLAGLAMRELTDQGAEELIAATRTPSTNQKPHS